MLCRGKPLVPGNGSGAVLAANVGLSFWGGIDPTDGTVIDQSHPLCGQSVAGKVLALPSGRGSCTGSQVVLELLLGGKAPSAVLLSQSDEIIPLGVIVGEELFSRSLPIVRLSEADFAYACSSAHARIGADGSVHLSDDVATDSGSAGDAHTPSRVSDAELAEHMQLRSDDLATLGGAHGAAAQVAMRILLRVARLQGVRELLDVTQVHIDGCTYIGPASLRFAQQLLAWQGRFKVPTTLNAISVDQRRWRALGVSPVLGEPASALGDAYVALGAQASFTCAPYLLESAPCAGENIGWGESNAVVYANSCLGARTQKYADFLDACIALTGRAPAAGCHLDAGRRARLVLRLDPCLQARVLGVGGSLDDAFWPTLGYLVGLKAASKVPVLTGLERVTPSRDDLKAFSAAFGTTASVALFHLAGITPEAPTLKAALGLSTGSMAHAVDQVDQATMDLLDVAQITLSLDDMVRVYATLNGHATETESAADLTDKAGGLTGSVVEGQAIELVALGNPHFSVEECARLAEMLASSLQPRHEGVSLVLTLGRATLEEARRRGYVQPIEAFGATLVTDTCWCMLTEPVVPPSARTIITNSAKYAHYGPGLVGRRLRFANLAGCVEAATSGRAPTKQPSWLANSMGSTRAVHLGRYARTASARALRTIL